VHLRCFGDLRIDNTNKKQDNALEKYRIATFLVAVTQVSFYSLSVREMRAPQVLW